MKAWILGGLGLFCAVSAIAGAEPFGVSFLEGGVPSGVVGGVAGGMSFSLADTWSHMGSTAQLVHLVLFLMAVASLSVLVERYGFFRRKRAESSLLVAEIRSRPEGMHGASNRRAVDRIVRTTRHELGLGLRSLLVVGLMAPLVGLLALVAGLLNVARATALTGSSGLGAVSAGIAEAFVPLSTALLIGIPSLWAYGFLRARQERIVFHLSELGDLEDTAQ